MKKSSVEIESELLTLEETQKAILNILEDTETEKVLLGNMQKAVINILDDYSEEKYILENTQRAVLNILDDYSVEKKLAEDTQKAVINILEDYSIEKAGVEEINIRLRSSNKEIEQFAYIASHDLQEPLRTISNYVGMFSKQYKGKLDERADIFLESIMGATGRMQSLIKDLLDYSRIGKDETKIPIDCNLLLKDVLNDMAVTVSENNAEIHADNLPEVAGYVTGLKSLFQNLISNALKFKKAGVNPVITITAQSQPHKWLFAFKDNGIGIEEAYYDKLFIIFQRLHNKEEYPGTGIGLAQCNKIVEMHGGNIWVESVINVGSSFYFTIPKEN
ncbi:MAG: hypothetical protein JWO32_2227 [Bacteroidetes bacterium]|nr:hypothetical protein [Bacteroidota bacterium]